MKKLFLILATLLALAVNPAFAQKSNGGSVSGSLTAADSGTCSGSTSCVWMTFPAYQFPFNTTITVSGTWAGTLSIQGNNGGIWTTIGTTTSNETVTTWATQYTDIRVLEIAYTSGTAVVKIAREAITPGESSGQIVFSSATSGTHTFTQPYNAAPVCVAGSMGPPRTQRRIRSWQAQRLPCSQSQRIPATARHGIGTVPCGKLADLFEDR